MARKIFFVTGARSDFDILLPVAQSVRARGDLPEWIVCATHLSPFHGHTVNSIEETSGIPIAGRVPSLIAGDTWLDRGLSISNLVGGLVRFLDWKRPDIAVVAGDHDEQFAAALAASVLQIPVGHIFGGDRCLSSDWDEVLRPAISKFSHLHFAASEGHRQRLIRMGELENRVWNTGGPNLDVLMQTAGTPIEALAKDFNFDPAVGYLLLIMHPTPMLPDENEDALEETLRGMLTLGLPILASYPNTDPSNARYRDVLDDFSLRYDNVRLHHNVPTPDWVGLFRHAEAIVGNSSSIVIESTILGIPGLLVGRRQELRECGTNVLRVSAREQEVVAGLAEILTYEFRVKSRRARSLYGDGRAADRIAEILGTQNLDGDLLRKVISY